MRPTRLTLRATLALALTAVVFTLIAFGTNNAKPTSMYRDYLRAHPVDQCSLPLAQRTGPWFCS